MVKISFIIIILGKEKRDFIRIICLGSYAKKTSFIIIILGEEKRDFIRIICLGSYAKDQFYHNYMYLYVYLNTQKSRGPGFIYVCNCIVLLFYYMPYLFLL